MQLILNVPNGFEDTNIFEFHSEKEIEKVVHNRVPRLEPQMSTVGRDQVDAPRDAKSYVHWDVSAVAGWLESVQLFDQIPQTCAKHLNLISLLFK